METIKDTQYVTDLEKEVIKSIINSEYMSQAGEGMIDYSVWSFTATDERKDLAGALGSLVKKGLCFANEFHTTKTKVEPVCGLTKEGYYWAKNNGLCL